MTASPASSGALLRMPGGATLTMPDVAAKLAVNPVVARTVAVSRPVMRTAARAVTTPAPAVGRVATRLITGRPLTGRARTDATFWRRGQKLLRQIDGETGAWSFRCGAERASLRFCAASVAWANLYSFAPAETMLFTYGGATAAVAAAVWGVCEFQRTKEHRRKYLIPLHAALKEIARTTAVRPEEWLHIPADFKQQPGVELRIDLPAQFTGSDGSSAKIKSIVIAKLGLASDTVAQFHAAGNKPYAVFREPLKLPKMVTLDDLMPLLKKSLDTEPIIGFAARNVPISVDLKSESPHVLISGSTGSGKSVLLRAILAQGLAKGGYGIIFDVKKFSHLWAKNLPNVEYHGTAESIHYRLLELRDVVDKRLKIVEDGADEDGNTDHIDVGHRIFLLAEEMNATIGRLQDYWKDIRDKKDPPLSPAIRALQDLLFMGRAIKIHVLAVAQMASARSMGGGEARENYTTRCLARYTNNAWRMLAPEVWPPPKKSRHEGRWQIVTAGVATETQVAYLTAREARRLALTAQPAPSHDAPPQPAPTHSPAGPGAQPTPTAAASPAPPVVPVLDLPGPTHDSSQWVTDSDCVTGMGDLRQPDPRMGDLRQKRVDFAREGASPIPPTPMVRPNGRPSTTETTAPNGVPLTTPNGGPSTTWDVSTTRGGAATSEPRSPVSPPSSRLYSVRPLAGTTPGAGPTSSGRRAERAALPRGESASRSAIGGGREIAGEIADEIAGEIADEIADEMADEMAGEMAGEVIEGQRLVGLRQAIVEAVQGGYAPAGLSIHKLRKYRERDPATFPNEVNSGPSRTYGGKEKLYDAEQLARYIRNIDKNAP